MDQFRFKFVSIVLYGVVVLMAGGCASTNIPMVDDSDYQVYADEQRIFNRSKELNAKIEASDILYVDEGLERYLNDVLGRLAGNYSGIDHLKYEVKVINDTIVNAYAMPSGRIYLNTATLALMENEAQLAAVLAHELTHIIERHVLKVKRSTSNKAAWLNSLSVLTPITGLASVAAITGYSQQVEFQADRGGFELMAAHGYDSREAIRLFKRIKQYIEDEDIHSPLFFSSHPRTQARIKNFQELLEDQGNSLPSDMYVHADEFRLRTQKVRLTAVRQWMKAGMFTTAYDICQRMIEDDPNMAEAYLHQASILRKRPSQKSKKDRAQRQKSDDHMEALRAVQTALQLQPDMTEAWMEQGMILQKLNRDDQARDSYRRYLELHPAAVNRSYLEQFIHAD